MDSMFYQLICDSSAL